MHFVKDDVANIVEGRRSCIHHVAKNLGGHHHHRSLGLYCNVTCEKPDVLLAVQCNEIVELLVRQRLQRCRVKRSLLVSQRRRKRIFGNDGLSAPRRSRNDDIIAPNDCIAGFSLETIERERKTLRKPCVVDPAVVRRLLSQRSPPLLFVGE